MLFIFGGKQQIHHRLNTMAIHAHVQMIDQNMNNIPMNHRQPKEYSEKQHVHDFIYISTMMEPPSCILGSDGIHGFTKLTIYSNVVTCYATAYANTI